MTNRCKNFPREIRTNLFYKAIDMFRDEGGRMASTVGTSYQKFEASRSVVRLLASGNGLLISTAIGTPVWWQTDFTLKAISVTSRWIDAQIALCLSDTVMVRLHRVQPDIKWIDNQYHIYLLALIAPCNFFLDYSRFRFCRCVIGA